MFKHEKKLLHKVRVEKPNPQYAVLMQEQLGGCNGELKAAMQYLSQSFRANDPVFKDLFLDIGTEELSHMEMVAETINLLNGGDVVSVRGFGRFVFVKEIKETKKGRLVLEIKKY